MTVRRAVFEDIPRLVELAAMEHAMSRFASAPFNEQVASHAFAQAVRAMHMVVFFSGGGYLAGMVQPMLFHRGWNAYELAWFAQDGSGMALLRAFKDWASSMRAQEVVVHNYAGVIEERRMSRALSRHGFKPVGSSYAHAVAQQEAAWQH